MSTSTVAGPGDRLLSLDAYRGFIMLAMASRGLRIPQVAREHFPNHSAWQFLAGQLDHVVWRGCCFWDLIQPSFMFMVGVSMAWSYEKRRELGHSFRRMLGHAAWRSVVLVLLGIFLVSNGSTRTDFTFVNVLTQIGLGYTFLFLLWNRPWAVQLGVALLILVGYWAAFYVYPVPKPDYDYSHVGIDANWSHLTGNAAHWDKNTNFASAVDERLLNWFPREKPFAFNVGGYQTLNFVPSLATMIFGLLAGGLMRGSQRNSTKFWLLLLAGGTLLWAGFGLDRYGICPSVKRIWTPAWTLYSSGWTFLMLGAFYGLFDLTGWQRIAVPLAVVGINSILVYCLAQVSWNWILASMRTHLGQSIFQVFGAKYEPIVESASALFVIWLICVWLYRRRLFFKI